MNQSTTPCTPHEIVERQVRIAPALAYLHSWAPSRPVVADPTPLPISDETVAAWIAAHPFLRAGLAPHVARSLAYLDVTFKRGAA